MTNFHNRREFLAVAGSATLAAAAPGAVVKSRMAPKTWIDPKLADLPARPWRKIHLDFHNSKYVARIGENFNADEFGDRLLKANVSGIVVFAKDMHGYFYYPSQYGPVHPGLKFDLLGAQVAALRKRKIAVYAYYCTTWDNYLAAHHAEWLQIGRNGSNFLPKANETPNWTALCLSHDGFVKLMLDHTREFVSRYEVDGAWFDVPVPRGDECFCPECLRALRAEGLDPNSREVQLRRSHDLHLAFIRRVYKTVKETRPGCQVDFNQQGRFGLKQRLPYIDNIDLEALPTAGWGYYSYPTAVRYVRTYGVSAYGLTGRFEAVWGDFGGLKLPSQMELEVAGIVANGGHCGIGDQMPPRGVLDPAVYDVIGQAFGRVKALEPYLEQAAPVTEAALVTSGLPSETPTTVPNYGLSKLLMESKVQFDIVEPEMPWERYGLIVLAEDKRVSGATAERLHSYIAGGGAVIALHEGGLVAATETSWLERYGFAFAGRSPFKPAYMTPKQDFTPGISPYQYALYEGASQWRIKSPASAVAQLGEPAFQRSPQHYTSHAQTPFDHQTEYAAIARAGKVALFGFPLGLSYYNRGYWVYRAAFQHVLKSLLPVPVVESSAPLTSEVTLTHQAARRDTGRKERYMVHIVNYCQNRATPKHPAFYEDVIALTDVKVRLNLPVGVKTARALVSGEALKPVRAPSGGFEVTVPRIQIHEVICFTLG